MPTAQLLVLVLELLELDESLVPARLERACDDAVLGIAGIVLSLGPLGLVARSVDAEAPLLLEGSILLLDDLDDARRRVQVLARQGLQHQRHDRNVDEAS